jgi:hypothetical protein
VQVYSEPTKTRKLLKYLFEFPWPLSDRHLVLEFYAVPMQNCVMIAMKTPTSEKFLDENVPQPQPGETRIQVNLGCIFVEHISETESKLTIMMSANANVVIFPQSFLPQFLINFGTKHIMYYIMETVKEKIENLEGSIFADRIQSRSEYYDYIKQMMAAYVRHS